MTRIELRRGTANEWAAADPILAVGEPGFETDTGNFKLGDGTTPWSRLPKFLNETWLDATDGRRGDLVLNVKDYGAKGDGTTNDTTGLQNALNAATAGSTVFFPAGDYIINTNPLTVPSAADGLTICGTKGSRITQQTWAKPVFDMPDVDDATVRDLTLSNSAGVQAGRGTFRGENTAGYAAGVWSNGHRNTFSNLRLTGFQAALMLSGWDSAAGAIQGFKYDNTISNILVSECAFGLLAHCQNGLVIDNLRGRDIVTGGNGEPPHIVYLSGNAATRHADVRASNLYGYNVPAHAFQFKYADGLVATNLVADNCSGALVTMDVTNATFSNVEARNPRSGTSDSAIVFDVDINNQTRQGNITLTGATVDLGSTTSSFRSAALLANMEQVKVSNLRVMTNVTDAASTCSVVRLQKNDQSLDNVTIFNKGYSTRGVYMGYPNTAATRISVANIVAHNCEFVVLMDGAISDFSISYDPARITAQASTTYVRKVANDGVGYWVNRASKEKLHTVTASSTVIPPNALAESVTHYKITVASVSITVPVPYPVTHKAPIGFVHEIAIENASGGAIGTVTWDAAYVFSRTYTVPASGRTTRLRFRYDGTSWVQLA